MTRSYNLLILGTGDTARSVMVEVIMNRKGAPRFRAFSAGSHPPGRYAQRHCAKLKRRSMGVRRRLGERFAPYSPSLSEESVCFFHCRSLPWTR